MEHTSMMNPNQFSKGPLLHNQNSYNLNVHLVVRIEQEVITSLILKKMKIHPNL
jgi:hypothetical protein